MKLIIRLHLVPRLRFTGARAPLPQCLHDVHRKFIVLQLNYAQGVSCYFSKETGKTRPVKITVQYFPMLLRHIGLWCLEFRAFLTSELVCLILGLLSSAIQLPVSFVKETGWTTGLARADWASGNRLLPSINEPRPIRSSDRSVASALSWLPTL